MNAKVNFGKTDWNTKKGGNDFLSLNKDGQYELRIIGDAPFEYAIHWAEDENGNTKKVNCAGRGCVLCADGNKAQVKYLLEVLNQTEASPDNGKCQIVEFGTQVFNQIAALKNNKYWGDPRLYNILVDRLKARGPSDMYQVMAVGQKGELDASLAAKAVEFKERIESVMGKFASPSKNEEILEKLGKNKPKESASLEAGATESAAVAEDDGDWNF